MVNAIGGGYLSSTASITQVTGEAGGEEPNGVANSVLVAGGDVCQQTRKGNEKRVGFSVPIEHIPASVVIA